MAEISSLKIKLASADKDRRDLDDRLRLSQVTAWFYRDVILQVDPIILNCIYADSSVIW